MMSEKRPVAATITQTAACAAARSFVSLAADID